MRELFRIIPKNLDDEEKADMDIVPSEYFELLSLDEKIKELKWFIEYAEEELNELKNPFLQMSDGIGLISVFKDFKGPVDKATAINSLELNINVAKLLLCDCLEEMDKS